jgi:hypothetical protein
VYCTVFWDEENDHQFILDRRRRVVGLCDAGEQFGGSGLPALNSLILSIGGAPRTRPFPNPAFFSI